jgi:hypothetical protein
MVQRRERASWFARRSFNQAPEHPDEMLCSAPAASRTSNSAERHILEPVVGAGLTSLIGAHYGSLASLAEVPSGLG